MKIANNRCPLCSGIKQSSTVTFTVDLGKTLIVIRNTTVCSLCGEEWIDDSVAMNLETVVNEAKRKQCVIFIWKVSKIILQNLTGERIKKYKFSKVIILELN